MEKTLFEKWLLGGVLRFPKYFTKFTEEYFCQSLYLILLKVFRPSVRQSFTDVLQSGCSKKFHKFRRKTYVMQSFEGLQLYSKETPTQPFSSEICKIFFYDQKHISFTFPNVVCDIKHVNILMKSTTALKLTIFVK